MRESGWNVFILMAWLLSSCSYVVDKNPPPKIPPPGQYSPGQLTYFSVYEQVLRPSCIGCHGSGGGINLETYENVKLQQDKIQNAVFILRSMPKAPNSPLSADQLGLLNAWLLAGMPKTAPDAPPPVTIPLEPTFASIKYHILEPKCLQCHAPQKPVARIPLVTREDIVDSPLELAIPGNAEESGLYLAITHHDPKKLMPPAASGLSPLSEAEIRVIYDWIQRGAQ